ncbi:SDR family NAD(P)-dependent oxidoreductase, partial [Streptomyces anulatus]|uniref:SDR family NAD(P)-dependent oxidoreductase n=1 Tax=Streptomyces anulatus TaxID=1892 RepID=UPI0034150F53
MKTVVISGGTDGIGREIARTRLSRGDNVVVIGRNAEKGKALTEAAGESGAGARVFFVAADLSLVRENRRVVEEIAERFPVVDALVLCARHYRARRRETAEGFEDNFALFYLSRFLLGHGLAGSLERAERPVIMNVAGPGADLSMVHWDDLQLRRGYDGGTALTQGGKL